MLPEPLRPKQLHHLQTWPSQGQTQVLQGSLRNKLPHAEVEIKPQLKPRAAWLRKKTQNLPTSCTGFGLNPHDKLGRLCVYGISERTLKVLTKENALVLIAVDIGGKNTQE